MTLKELVAKDNIVRFTRYFDGQLWYQTYRQAEEAFYAERALDITGRIELIPRKTFEALGPEFPVPISDIGTATFLAEDRAMLFMRYIRKHLDMLEKAKTDPYQPLPGHGPEVPGATQVTPGVYVANQSHSVFSDEQPALVPVTDFPKKSV